MVARRGRIGKLDQRCDRMEEVFDFKAKLRIAGARVTNKRRARSGGLEQRRHQNFFDMSIALGGHTSFASTTARLIHGVSTLRTTQYHRGRRAVREGCSISTSIGQATAGRVTPIGHNSSWCAAHFPREMGEGAGDRHARSVSARLIQSRRDVRIVTSELNA